MLASDVLREILKFNLDGIGTAKEDPFDVLADFPLHIGPERLVVVAARFDGACSVWRCGISSLIHCYILERWFVPEGPGHHRAVDQSHV